MWDAAKVEKAPRSKFCEAYASKKFRAPQESRGARLTRNSEVFKEIKQNKTTTKYADVAE